jgi:flagellar biosynthesis chaperone FliJ
MSTLEQKKEALSKLVAKKKDFDAKITRAQAQQELYMQQLKEHGVDDIDDIDEEISKREDIIGGLNEQADKLMEGLQTYLAKLEKILNS